MFSVFLFESDLRGFKQLDVDQIDFRINQVTAFSDEFTQSRDNFLISFKAHPQLDDSNLLPQYFLTKRRLLNA